MVEARARTGPAVRLRTVLVVDDEPQVLTKLRLWLLAEGFQVRCCQTAVEAWNEARSRPADVALIDYRLGADDGVRLGKSLRESFDIKFVLFSGFLTPKVAFAAAKAGASGVISKPLSLDELLACLEQTFREESSVPSSERPNNWSRNNPDSTHLSNARRWAHAILSACEAQTDPVTADVLGRAIGMSPSSFRDLCHVCGVQKPHLARDLARFLRVLARNQGSGPLGSDFDVADERTRKRLFDRAGISPELTSISLHDFLCQQTLVRTDLPCLRELAHLAANSKWFL